MTDLIEELRRASAAAGVVAGHEPLPDDVDIIATTVDVVTGLAAAVVE